MTTTRATGDGLQRLVRGALEGAVGGAVGATLLRLVVEAGTNAQAVIRTGLAGALFGACVAALGRSIGRGLTGAVLGAVLGLFVGGMAAEYFDGRGTPAETSPEAEDAEAAKQELVIAGPTLDGRQISLKQLRGKVVLVDFWATWCGPCVKELPNVLEVYERYHARGFEVLGVSLDFQRPALEKFVKERKVPWPQIFFDKEDERGWDNPIARRYRIEGIPATYLVNQEGRVVAGYLPGSQLDKAVAQLLGQPPSEGAELRRLASRIVRLGTNSRTFVLLVLAGGVLGSLLGALVERASRKGTPPAAATPLAG